MAKENYSIYSFLIPILDSNRTCNYDYFIFVVFFLTKSLYFSSIQEHESLGKSWTFLVGVVVTVLLTSLLIFTALKCPVWYNFLLSYNHHRLEEHEDDFTGNSSSLSHIPDTNSEDTTVIFQQLHSFVVDDDGFIEDKYIDIHELCEEN